ncbi:glycosyltransferase family 4 protein [Photobacterium kagoshimensis]|uniref:glycosyltransferase family 4 protein n=1 Tax=Photobacterium kagoshimensis TaxID=2910242 RepID=UPI003D108855
MDSSLERNDHQSHPNRHRTASRHLLHVFPTFAIGGQQVRFAQIANACPQDYSHTIIALDGNFDAKNKLLATVNTTFIDLNHLKQQHVLQRMQAIQHYLADHPHDVLMTYNWGAIEWALVHRIRSRAATAVTATKHIHWEDGFGPEEQQDRLPRRNIFRRLALSDDTKVVVPSHQLQQIAQQDWHVEASQLIYFPNGIALPEVHTEIQPPSQHPTFITLATLRAEKNIPRLIDSFLAAVPNGKLIIGGGGPLLEELREYVIQLDQTDRIELTGNVTDIWGFLAQGNVFCLSSDTEQMPISILEAMAMGLPIVSTDVGDIKTMLPPENQAYIAAPADYPATMKKLLEHQDYWPTIGRANKLRVSQHYSFDTMINNFAALL